MGQPRLVTHALTALELDDDDVEPPAAKVASGKGSSSPHGLTSRNPCAARISRALADSSISTDASSAATVMTRLDGAPSRLGATRRIHHRLRRGEPSQNHFQSHPFS